MRIRYNVRLPKSDRLLGLYKLFGHSGSDPGLRGVRESPNTLNGNSEWSFGR